MPMIQTSTVTIENADGTKRVYQGIISHEVVNIKDEYGPATMNLEMDTPSCKNYENGKYTYDEVFE